MDQYAVTVVEYPAKRLVGVKVVTTMQRAKTDCPALWQTFCPRASELFKSAGECKGFFGVSVMINTEEFEYWAATEIESSADIPAGMARIDIPAGQYAKCAVPSLEKLGDVYMHLYSDWLKEHPAYAYDERHPCFELYPPNWQVNDSFDVFMAVKKA